MPPLKKIAKRFTSWSISRYRDWVQCPLKAKLKHLDKITEPPNQAMERGGAIGRLAEQYLKGQLAKLPDELKLFKKDFEAGRKKVKSTLIQTVVEDTWAMTKAWTQTVWNDWTGCYLRAKLDYAFVEKTLLDITDWKTGKFRINNIEEYIEQLELYCLLGLLLFKAKGVKKVRASLKYLDEGRTYPDPKLHEQLLEFTQADVPMLMKRWEARIKPMMADETFAPRPNNFCNWCHYRASNKENGGGQCKY